MIILDEPDSHLHPNNQRVLCKILQIVAEERSTQVFLTTHSRHVVDALSGHASFLWVRSGTVEKFNDDYELAVLLDIGALDVKKMISQSKAKCIVLTEDSIKIGIEKIITSSGIENDDVIVLSYYGCTGLKNLKPLLNLMRNSNDKAKIVLHRDRDYYTDDDLNKWSEEVRKFNVEPFLTRGVDIESEFLQSKHLAEINEEDEDYFDSLITKAVQDNLKDHIERYVNGILEIEKKNNTFKSINVGQLAVSAPEKFNLNVARYRHSKTVLRKIKELYQNDKKNNLNVYKASPFLKSDIFYSVSKKFPKR